MVSKLSTFLVCALSVVVPLIQAVPWEPTPRHQLSGWDHKHEVLLNRTAAHAADIQTIFLGDSITEGWLGGGHALWEAHYAKRHSYNYGIGGDHTEHVLWRIQNEFEGVKPKLVVLMIGKGWNLLWVVVRS